jgi:hypothetical protein
MHQIGFSMLGETKISKTTPTLALHKLINPEEKKDDEDGSGDVAALGYPE